MPNKPTIFLEDFQPGQIMEYDCGVITEEEIIEFATKFDPQYFHIDPQTAQQSAYKGLIASGWHTASIMMRAIVELYLTKAASLGSPGVDELRWLLPVRPGDNLVVRATIESARKSAKKPEMGILITFVQVFNQHEQLVMTMKGTGFFKCRNSD